MIQQSPKSWLLLGTALSLSVGWGIRGNFGHEYGAMIPGALASLAALVLSGRPDWWPKAPYFGFFGALGWSFGGSISYMQVIAYTHSGHSASVLYGFACLFVIGFLWGAMGGAGLGLAACLTPRHLAGFLGPVAVVLMAWCVQDVVVERIWPTDSQFRQANPLYWYDTDWLAALVALVTVLLLALIRRRIDDASSLVLHMAIGWWAGFLLLVLLLGWRMTPPRGDNWAGCVGMVVGLWTFLQRRGWAEVTAASLITGFVGGLGFSVATLFKLVEIKSGLQTNWHSVLEQTYGCINGIGLALAVLYLAHRAKPSLEQVRRAEPARLAAAAFVLLVITYVNLRKNPAVWVTAKTVPGVLYGVSAEAWFTLGFLVLAAAMIALMLRHRRQPIACIPQDPLGQAQVLYLVLLWWMVVGNFERALTGFAPERLVTEGVIHLNAALSTLIILLGPTVQPGQATLPSSKPGVRIPQIVALGVLIMLGSVTADWAIVRALYRDQPAGYSALHIRFGPGATATSAKPKADRPHP